MPNSKFVRQIEVQQSFRNEKIKGMFDVEKNVIRKEFSINIPIEGQNWNVGLIIGASGSGKTTVAREMFSDYVFFEGYEWNNQSVVDNFKESLTATEIVEALSKVGFSSPPDWLKPFSVLSNGQKMRAELARLILEEDKPVIYDEFTSVVDRQVAKIGSSAIQKFIRKENKQFIAVTCHYDVEKWLEPDWVYNMDTNEFSRRSLRRPDIQIDIRRAEQSEWKIFKEFHYLSAEHSAAAHRYIAEIDGQPVAWCSVIHQPHPKATNLKRIHRIVVRPDYQGIGVGNRFMSQVAQIYKNQKYRITLVTSTPAFIKGLQRSKNWIMIRKPSRTALAKGELKGSTSSDRLTASFEYAA